MKKKILFICSGNASRSQMAEAFTKTIGNDEFIVKSAGCTPADSISRNAIKAMKEIGIDITNHQPKKIDESFAKKADKIIILNPDVAKKCPQWLVKKAIVWNIEDTKDKDFSFYQKIREEINKKLMFLLQNL